MNKRIKEAKTNCEKSQNSSSSSSGGGGNSHNAVYYQSMARRTKYSDESETSHSLTYYSHCCKLERKGDYCHYYYYQHIASSWHTLADSFALLLIQSLAISSTPSVLSLLFIFLLPLLVYNSHNFSCIDVIWRSHTAVRFDESVNNKIVKSREAVES